MHIVCINYYTYVYPHIITYTFSKARSILVVRTSNLVMFKCMHSTWR